MNSRIPSKSSSGTSASRLTRGLRGPAGRSAPAPRMDDSVVRPSAAPSASPTSFFGCESFTGHPAMQPSTPQPKGFRQSIVRRGDCSVLEVKTPCGNRMVLGGKGRDCALRAPGSGLSRTPAKDVEFSTDAGPFARIGAARCGKTRQALWENDPPWGKDPLIGIS